MSNKRKLEIGTKLVCGDCKVESTIPEWDKSTENECITRQQRRDFVSSDSERAYHKDTKIWYLCPKCGDWVKANRIKILKNKEQTNTTL